MNKCLINLYKNFYIHLKNHIFFCKLLIFMNKALINLCEPLYSPLKLGMSLLADLRGVLGGG